MTGEVRGGYASPMPWMDWATGPARGTDACAVARMAGSIVQVEYRVLNTPVGRVLDPSVPERQEVA